MNKTKTTIVKIYRTFRKESTSLLIVFIGFTIILTILFLFLWLDINIDVSKKINSEKFGHFGDFIGGVVGSIWALAGVLLFYKALVEQRKDFKTNRKTLATQVDALNNQVIQFQAQTEELVNSRKIYEQQTKTLLIQQFESNFYSLLNVYISVKDKLNKKKTDFFVNLYNDFSISFSIDNDPIIFHNKMVEAYKNLFESNREELSHFFKLFYRILKIIDSNKNLEEDEKIFYAKILRSQLTDFEQLILYYNSHTEYGKKARTIILKYNLLKHTPIFNMPNFKFFNDLESVNLIHFNHFVKEFLINNLNDSYDIDYDFNDVVERYDEFKCFVGIYHLENTEFRIICDKDISKNNIRMDENSFQKLLLHIIVEHLILQPYMDTSKITIEKYITNTDVKKTFGFKIKTNLQLKLNCDNI